MHFHGTHRTSKHTLWHHRKIETWSWCVRSESNRISRHYCSMRSIFLPRESSLLRPNLSILTHHVAFALPAQERLSGCSSSLAFQTYRILLALFVTSLQLHAHTSSSVLCLTKHWRYLRLPLKLRSHHYGVQGLIVWVRRIFWPAWQCKWPRQHIPYPLRRVRTEPVSRTDSHYWYLLAWKSMSQSRQIQ